MRCVASFFIAVLISLAVSSSATAQLGGLGTGGGGLGAGGAAGGAGQRVDGLQQTGSLSSEAAIQRDAGSFVGSSAGSFLSKSGTTGGSGFGGGTNLTSLSTLTGLSAFGTSIGGGIGRGFGGGGGFGGTGFGAQGFQAQGTATTPQLRIPVRLGFTPRRTIAPTAVSAGFQARLARLPGLESVAAGVAVKMDGRTAVLEGVVTSPHERELIARLALLEPGISTVQNDLRVELGPRPAEAPSQ